MKNKKKLIFIIAILVIIAIIVVWIGVHNKSLEVNRINILSEKIPEGFTNFRIAQVSDLHNTEIGDDNEKLIARLKKSEPDIIAITGDLIDSRHTDIETALEFAERAAKIAPCYYVNGNHEGRVLAEYEKLKKGLSELGVTILENKEIEITNGDDTISLIGVNDPKFRMKLVDDTMDQNVAYQLSEVVSDNNNYKILLAHRPEYFKSYAGQVDLVLSGHAHGGQFRLPFVGGLVAPGQGLFPEYDSGLYTEENTNMVVSRGIGNSIIPFRINNRPEIVVIELEKLAE